MTQVGFGLFAARTGRTASRIILGSGAHTYEVEPDWGRLPDSVHYGYTHGVVVDAQHRILVHNQSRDASGHLRPCRGNS